MKRIPTGDNNSDARTKNKPRILFNRHVDFHLGQTPQQYAPIYTASTEHDTQKLNVDTFSTEG